MNTDQPPTSTQNGQQYQSQKPGRRPRFRFLTLWRPPTALVVASLAGLLFAAGGVMAIRFSNAQTAQLAPGAVSEARLWQDVPAANVGTAISGDEQLPLWQKTPQHLLGGGRVDIVADNIKGRAIQFSVPARPDQQSASTSPQSAVQVPEFEAKLGQTYWFGFDLSVVTTEPSSNDVNHSLWQLAHGSEPYFGKLRLTLNTKQQSLALETGTASLPLGTAPNGDWSRLTVGVHVDVGAQAWVEVWRDGQNVVQRLPLPEGSIRQVGEGPINFRTGIYRGGSTQELKVKMANLVIAGSLEQAL